MLALASSLLGRACIAATGSITSRRGFVGIGGAARLVRHSFVDIHTFAGIDSMSESLQGSLACCESGLRRFRVMAAEMVARLNLAQPTAEFLQVVLIFLELGKREFLAARFLRQFRQQLLAPLAEFGVLLVTICAEAFDDRRRERLIERRADENRSAPALPLDLGEKPLKKALMRWRVRQHDDAGLQSQGACRPCTAPNLHTQTRG